MALHPWANLTIRAPPRKVSDLQTIADSQAEQDATIITRLQTTTEELRAQLSLMTTQLAALTTVKSAPTSKQVELQLSVLQAVESMHHQRIGGIDEAHTITMEAEQDKEFHSQVRHYSIIIEIQNIATMHS